MSEASPIVSARSCGSCTMCCKLFDIPPVDNKPAGKWCKNCSQGKGCSIWETRPQMCADYFCHWHSDKSLGPEWRPDSARFILSREPGGVWLSIVVDVSQPHAWRKEPYHRKLRTLAQRLIESGTNGLLLIEGDRKSVVLPDREIFIGTRLTHTNLSFTKKMVGGVVQYDVVFNEKPVVPANIALPGSPAIT